jgi:hypothetical protein
MLILGKKDGFLTTLSNYLRFFTADSVADKYPDLLVRSTTYLELLDANYSGDLFRILKTASIRMKKLNLFDGFLESASARGKVDPQEVKRYIFESWQVKQRDLQPLLEGYQLANDPDLSVLGIYFAYLSGDFSKALNGYPGTYTASQGKENDIKPLRIDLPYILVTALFREGRYREATRDIRRVYFPERNDLPEIRYLSYLGLGEWKNAAAEIASMRSESKTWFYTGLDMVLENPSNGMEYLEKYIQELDESQEYLSSSLLLYYAMVKKPERTSQASEQVKRSLLYRDTAPVDDLPLSYAFVRRASTLEGSAKPNGTVAGFVRYKLALDWARNGKKEDAKKAMFDLIRATNTSPVIRSLAVYRAREME